MKELVVRGCGQTHATAPNQCRGSGDIRHGRCRLLLRKKASNSSLSSSSLSSGSSNRQFDSLPLKQSNVSLIPTPIEETVSQIDSVEYPRAYPDVVDSPRQIHSQFTLISLSGRSVDKSISISDRGSIGKDINRSSEGKGSAPKAAGSSAPLASV